MSMTHMQDRTLWTIMKVWWFVIGLQHLIGSLTPRWDPAPSLINVPEWFIGILGIVIMVGSGLALYGDYHTFYANDGTMTENKNWAYIRLGVAILALTWALHVVAALCTHSTESVPISMYATNFCVCAYRWRLVNKFERDARRIQHGI